MAILKCKMCGGDLSIKEGMTVCECEYCNTKQTVPSLDDDKKVTLFTRANRLRSLCEFDKAYGVYESIVVDYPEEAEAYWGLILCKYGIEYVDDPTTLKKIPTCHRSSFDSLLEDSNYEMVLEYSDLSSRVIYREEAKKIEDLRKSIIEISGKEEPYDIFICYKETDENGERTIDSVIAQDVYKDLTSNGYRVFFSRITLEDKLGQEYEPYIFAALHSSKVMLVFGTDYEYFNAVWVKNEWSRYLQLISQGEKKTLIPCYKGLDAYDMPKEFARLQAQDMGKVGAVQDLLRGIDKIFDRDNLKKVQIQPQIVTNVTNQDALLKRVDIFLEEGEWAKADEYCEQILDQNPENAQAYFGKLMAELHVSRKEDLGTLANTFEDSKNFKNAIRFGDENIVTELEGFNSQIRYSKALQLMQNANTEAEYQAAAELFNAILGYGNADVLEKQCIERAQASHNDAVYDNAKKQMDSQNKQGYMAAIGLFEQITGWKDTDALIVECRNKINDIDEQVISKKYDYAVSTMNKADSEKAYKSAASLFRELGDYKDSNRLASECMNYAEEARKDAIYQSAKSNMYGDKTYRYEEAISAFETLQGWNDSDFQIEECRRRIDEIKANEINERKNEEYKKRSKKKIITISAVALLVVAAVVIISITVIIPKMKYNKAMKLIESGEYDSAYALLEEIGDTESINQNKYERAIQLASVGDFESAYVLFTQSGHISDIVPYEYDRAMELIDSGDYDSAYSVLENIGYDDVIASSKCERAVALLESGDNVAAFNLLYGIDNSESNQLLEEIYNDEDWISECPLGGIIRFGSFEQDNDTSNGDEPIEWIVLDRIDNRVLVISRFVLGEYDYGDSGSWEMCPIRDLLNNQWINDFFTNEEREMITNSSGLDLLFLLSHEEAFQYGNEVIDYYECYGSNAGTATEACGSVGGWWLRDCGESYDGQPCPYFVYTAISDGYDISEYIRVHTYIYDDSPCGVRPAMWIEY